MFLARLHNSQLKSQSDTRKDVADIMSKLAKVEEDIKAIHEFCKAAAMKVKATDMQNEDVAMLRLKFKSVEKLQAACDDPEKRLAILRILNSGLISTMQSKVCPEALSYFIDEDLLTRLFIKVPPG